MTAPRSFLTARILVVDDQPSNVTLLERLLKRSGYPNVVSTTDSSEVIHLCRRTDPDLVVLDLQMPPPDGFELLEQLDTWGRDRAYLPILVVTADITPEAMERALSLGASDFVTKPFLPAEVRLRIANLLATRRLTLDQRNQNDVLEQRVRMRTRDLEEARLELLERLALATEYRDDSTHEHTERVGRACALLAHELGLGSDEVELIRRAAPLHDIGKLAVPDTILLKPGKLTADEFELVKTHTIVGRGILAGSRSPMLQLSETIALTHHERWDGGGYPQGLSGADIPLVGRLAGLADVFDALTHERPYKEAWPLPAALAEVRMLAGTQLDPDLVALFEGFDHEYLLTPVEATDMLHTAS